MEFIALIVIEVVGEIVGNIACGAVGFAINFVRNYAPTGTSSADPPSYLTTLNLFD